MSQAERANSFAAMHVKGAPVPLYNAWDAGSAKAIVAAGAKVIATSSWAVSEAQGYRDGETISPALFDRIIGRITATIDVPVTVDFEGGYSDDDDETLIANMSRLLDTGLAGINFEDRVVKGSGLHETKRQAQRIELLRLVARGQKVPLFINARTDLFFGPGDPVTMIDSAIERAKAYEAAGASGFFVPGLRDEALIGRLCAAVTMPVNIMVMDGVPSIPRLAELGVARISYGAIPYVSAMNNLRKEATRALELTHGGK